MVLRRTAQVACFLLLAACAGAWATSYVSRDRLTRFSRTTSGTWYLDTTATVTSDTGRVSLMIERSHKGNFSAEDAELLERMRVADVPTTWSYATGRAQGTSTLRAYSWLRRRWGVTWGHNRSTSRHGGHNKYCVELPYWVLSVPVALINLVVFRRAVLRLRQLDQVRRRVCIHCGYDLRASRGRCPECGKAILVLAVGS